MSRNQIAWSLMTLGTILLTSSLLFDMFPGLDTVHASTWAPAPPLDQTQKIKAIDPSQGCDARFVAASNNSNYIVASDCNLREDNYGKTCIRCNGKYMMITSNQTPPGGDGVGSSFTVTCGMVEEGRCTGRSASCEDFHMTNVSCGDVTEYGKQAIPGTDPDS